MHAADFEGSCAYGEGKDGASHIKQNIVNIKQIWPGVSRDIFSRHLSIRKDNYHFDLGIWVLEIFIAKIYILGPIKCWFSLDYFKVFTTYLYYFTPFNFPYMHKAYKRLFESYINNCTKYA